MKNLKKQNHERGITLIALIITIIILLILAMVSIKIMIDNNIITHAKTATTKYAAEQEKEIIQLAYANYKLSGDETANLNIDEATVTGNSTNGWEITFDNTGNQYKLESDGTIKTSSNGGESTEDFDGTYYSWNTSNSSIKISGEKVSMTEDGDEREMQYDKNTKKLYNPYELDDYNNPIYIGTISKQTIGAEEFLILKDGDEITYFSEKQTVPSEYIDLEGVYDASTQGETAKFTFNKDGFYYENEHTNELAKYFVIDNKIFMEYEDNGYATLSEDKQTLTVRDTTYTKQ